MFSGFSLRTIDFMWGLRLNNEKAWFEAHKEDFQYTKAGVRYCISGFCMATSALPAALALALLFFLYNYAKF